MRICLSNFSVPKIGNSSEEIEDAYYPLNDLENTELDKIHLALADGATEGTYSKQWAEYLVNSFCTEYKESFGDLLAKVFDGWAKGQTAYINARRETSKQLLWYEEAGLEEGGFSTFLGLEIKQLDENGGGGQWKAIGVGDTCLFQVRKNKLITKFPLDHSDKFNNRPYLIASNPVFNKNLCANQREDGGSWLREDQFYLMTDALACWFLKSYESDNNPSTTVREFVKDESQNYSDGVLFPDWINTQRNSKNIRNDDITLVRLDLT